MHAILGRQVKRAGGVTQDACELLPKRGRIPASNRIMERGKAALPARNAGEPLNDLGPIELRNFPVGNPQPPGNARVVGSAVSSVVR